MKHARPMRPLSDTRWHILENIRDGKDVYDGFIYSALGGAIRSVQMWYGFSNLVEVAQDPHLVQLSEAGKEALETGRY